MSTKRAQDAKREHRIKYITQSEVLGYNIKYVVGPPQESRFYFAMGGVDLNFFCPFFWLFLCAIAH
jgi:hypothetical protein